MTFIATMLLALPLAVPAIDLPDVDIRLSRLPSQAYELHGTFIVQASTQAVWRVLTDYEGIPSFVSSMKESRVREMRADGSVLVEQKTTGGMVLFKRTVTILLEVSRQPQSLHFEDVGRESFWRYEGGWTTEEAPGGVKVTYHLIAQPDFVAPSFVLGRVMKRGARSLLNEVRAEIARRSGLERRKL